ncbi:MAG: aspartate/glutamate racemase family protein [Acidimicrobiia bacterium]
MTATIGFLHTAEAHRASFAALVDEIAPGVRTVHVVDETLLSDARTRGEVDDELRVRLLTRLRDSARDADVVVCTCSTISGAAEAVSNRLTVPVIRVDRPMAEQAVARGTRIAVVAALASAVAPTMALLQEVADNRGVSVRLVGYSCDDAWILFEQGDNEEYLRAVASFVDSLPGPVDAIVLAQASMAMAADLCQTDVPVLSSPRLAVAQAARTIEALNRAKPTRAVRPASPRSGRPHRGAR